MTTSGCSWGFWLAGASWLAMGGAIASFGDCAHAQIIPDTTLGASGSVVAPQAPGSTVDVISGGATRGANLFHSFEQFSVLTGREAFFNNAADIQNIIGRVTGGSISNIDGLIRANGAANLFLLNPNGIIFGPNARLDIRGSFLGSTASSLNFANGTQFSATNPQAPPLLTVSIPIGLQFGENPGSIRNQSLTDYVGLQVQPGKTLALVGGDVALEGGYLTAEAGRIELGSVAGPSLVSLSPTAQGWFLGYEGVQNFKDIRLSQQAVADTSGEGGGDIQVQGRRIEVRDGSVIAAFTVGSRSGGTLAVNASDEVELIGSVTIADYEFISGLRTDTQGAGAAGDLRITTGKLIVRDGAEVSASTSGQGKGGALVVTASDEVELSGTSADSQLPSGLFTQTLDTGDAGNLTIATGQLIVQGGAQVSASTLGPGQGGTLTVRASESVELSGAVETPDGQITSGLFAQTQGIGNAGSLTITTRKLIAQDGGQVVAGAADDSLGLGGTLTVRASESVELSGTAPNPQDTSGLFARTRGTGSAGDLTVNTGQLIVRDRAQVTVSGVESGDAGNLEVTARDLLLDNEGAIVAETASAQGGNITLDVQDLLLMRNNSRISTTAGTAKAGGDGGNIDINTNFLVAVPGENSDITANSFVGKGGTIDIEAEGIFGLVQRDLEELKSLLGTDDPNELNPARLPSSDITAISQTDPSLTGQVTINTPDIDPSRGLVALPAELVDASGLIASGCGAGVRQGESKFVITGRGGLPPNPSEALSSDAIQVDWVTLYPGVENSSSLAASMNSTAPVPAPLVEAQGWVINDKGEVVLIATAPTATPHIPWMTPTSCHASETSS